MTIIIISITLCASVYVLAYRAWKRRNWWAWYRRYLRSEVWRRKRAAKFAQVGRRCERADRTCSGAIQVHHRTYKHVGHESMSDLQVLCQKHHKDVTR